MIQNSIESFSGYLQIQNEEYYADPVLENGVKYSEELHQSIMGHENVKNAVPRVMYGSLASSGKNTKGVAILGIDTELEKDVIKPHKMMVEYKIDKRILDSAVLNTFPENIRNEIISNKGISFRSKDDIIRRLELKDKENDFADKILEKTEIGGSYINNEDDGVLIGSKLGRYLNLEVGDSIILKGSGYHGAIASGIYPVRGFVKLPDPNMNNKVVIMPIKLAQKLLYTGDLISYMAVNLHNNDDKEMLKTQEALNKELKTGLSVKNWKELNKELVQQISSDNKSGQIMLGVIYLIIAFGIFGTVLMMANERKREFAVMAAIGLKRRQIRRIMVLEMVFLGLIGIAAGLLASSPIIAYFHYNPIRMTGEIAVMMENYGFEPVMPFAWFNQYFFNQGFVVIIMIIVASIYPIMRTVNMNILKSMR
jgi:ABC-type lipoprotein release transport system permease subunit